MGIGADFYIFPKLQAAGMSPPYAKVFMHFARENPFQRGKETQMLVVQASRNGILVIQVVVNTWMICYTESGLNGYRYSA